MTESVLVPPSPSPSLGVLIIPSGGLSYTESLLGSMLSIMHSDTDTEPYTGLVEVTKINVPHIAEVMTADKEDYVCGELNLLSPFVGYTLKGFLLEEPQVGGQIRIDRVQRNGIDCPGYFCSSYIQSIEGDTITTCNSVYKITRKV